LWLRESVRSAISSKGEPFAGVAIWRIDTFEISGQTGILLGVGEGWSATSFVPNDPNSTSAHGPPRRLVRCSGMSAVEVIVLQKSAAPRPIAKNGQY
jgi:hypothetical protein